MIRSSLLCLCLGFGLFACGDDGGGGGGGGGTGCDTSTLTYANFGSQFFDSYCLQCHSTNASNRLGAPSSVNFDSLADVQSHAGRIKARAGVGTTMPPSVVSSIPSAQERADLTEWIECDTPQ